MIGDKIRKRLTQLNMTQRELSTKLNISPSTLSGYITGYRNPDINMVSQLAKVLNVSTSYLLDETSCTSKSSINIELSSEEKKDVAKSLEKFKKELAKYEQTTFEGEPLTDEARQSIISAIEMGLALARQKNSGKI